MNWGWLAVLIGVLAISIRVAVAIKLWEYWQDKKDSDDADS